MYSLTLFLVMVIDHGGHGGHSGKDGKHGLEVSCIAFMSRCKKTLKVALSSKILKGGQ